jgi:hypothetical protein
MANLLESLLNDEFGSKEDKKGTNGICENLFLLSNAKWIPDACSNPIGVAAAEYGQMKTSPSAVKFGRHRPSNRP